MSIYLSSEVVVQYVSFIAQNILPPPASSVQSLFGFLNGSPKGDKQDTVLTVKHTVLAVAWLAINQTVCSYLCLPHLNH